MHRSRPIRRELNRVRRTSPVHNAHIHIQRQRKLVFTRGVQQLAPPLQTSARSGALGARVRLAVEMMHGIRTHRHVDIRQRPRRKILEWIPYPRHINIRHRQIIPTSQHYFYALHFRAHQRVKRVGVFSKTINANVQRFLRRRQRHPRVGARKRPVARR